VREFDYEHNSIVEIINEIIIDAIENRASDIHFDPTKECLMVRIRIDGELHDYTKIPNILKKNVKIVLQLKNNITVTDTKSLFNNEEIDYSKLNYEESINCRI